MLPVERWLLPYAWFAHHIDLEELRNALDAEHLLVRPPLVLPGDAQTGIWCLGGSRSCVIRASQQEIPMPRKEVIGLFLTLVFLLATDAHAEPPGASVETLLETDQTVLGQDFSYPAGKAKITAAIVTLPPGASLPTHRHPVPLFAYILQGELLVDYGSEGQILYRKGDAFVEAFNWPHSGRNAGKGTVKIMAIYAGAVGVPNSVPVAAMSGPTEEIQ
jgi:quercetin dioxygenase-like cupin family protein